MTEKKIPEGEKGKEREEKRGSGKVEVLAPVYPGPAHHVGKNILPGGATDEKFRNSIIDEIVGGKTVVQVCREYGVDRRTLTRWLMHLKGEREIQQKMENIFIADVATSKAKELLNAMDKEKISLASLRDVAVAAGILIDKRKDLLGKQKDGGNLSLKVAWKDGSGAVEVKTSD